MLTATHIIGVRYYNSMRQLNAKLGISDKTYYYPCYDEIEIGDIAVVNIFNVYKLVVVEEVLSPTAKELDNKPFAIKLQKDRYEQILSDITAAEKEEEEFNYLLKKEQELNEYTELLKTTESPRVKELTQKRIDSIQELLKS